MQSIKNLEETSRAIVEDINKLSTADSLETLNTLNREIRLAMNALMIHLDSAYKDAQKLVTKRRAALNDELYKEL